MLYFPIDFGELTLDGPIDTVADSSVKPEADFRKTRLLAPQSIIKEGPVPSFQIMVANGDLETPKSTVVELKFEPGDKKFYEICIVMEKLSSPIIPKEPHSPGHAPRHPHFPYISIQLKTADHKYSNVMEPILSPPDVTTSPNDHTVIAIQSQIYAENAVTEILQPSDLLHEEGDVIFCAAMITLKEGIMRIVNSFTDQIYKLKKRIAFCKFFSD